MRSRTADDRLEELAGNVVLEGRQSVNHVKLAPILGCERAKDFVGHIIGKSLVHGSVPLQPSEKEGAEERIDHEIRICAGPELTGGDGFLDEPPLHLPPWQVELVELTPLKPLVSLDAGDDAGHHLALFRPNPPDAAREVSAKPRGG